MSAWEHEQSPGSKLCVRISFLLSVPVSQDWSGSAEIFWEPLARKTSVLAPGGLEGGGHGKGLGTMRNQIHSPESGGPDWPTPSLCKGGQEPRRDRLALVIEALPQDRSLSPDAPVSLPPAILVVRDAHLLPYSSFPTLQPHRPPRTILAFFFMPQGLCTGSSFCQKCPFPRAGSSCFWSQLKSPLDEAWPGRCIIPHHCPCSWPSKPATRMPLFHVSPGLVAHCLALPGSVTPWAGSVSPGLHSAGAGWPERQLIEGQPPALEQLL